ncbi:AbgT family transporter [Oceanicoccus sp. KOV_DT_Chl]|uniref:AbgT family transporter n=1 Tax=Oceanicoccus sp. KOV_DT_Chl TaxID=1904639 RepID=UPI000C7B302F|nr:AbgT family transporter [Oceanicoccus sp. KOV_DT_Chl]
MNHTSLSERLLIKIEQAGNKLPHPTLLFIYLCGFIIALSAITAAMDIHAIHPVSGDTITVSSLLSRDGLHLILTKSVSNFTQFAPVGSVLVAIMGIGVAERSGLIAAVLTATVLKAPRQLLSFFIVFSGVLSSLAMDTGYVVLIPLAALVFQAAGRHPIAGIAAAFAGVSGGFSANLLIGPVDAILGGISAEAASLVKPGYEVSAAANYYFIIVSTLLISVVGTWITEKIVIPRLGETTANITEAVRTTLNPAEKKALQSVGLFSVVCIALLLATLIPEQGLLRADNGSILNSPFIKGIVVLIAIYAAIAGLLYGKVSGNFTRQDDFIDGMETSISMMASYIVLMFFAAQFVSYFNWSQLGAISAINGAQFLQSMNLSAPTLMVSFVIMSALINCLIGSSSAKWALFAPIFVPMFLLLGISPEATQVAYRIGDSSTNIITPLMPYFGVVVAFVQRYDKEAGIGTIIATMLPYSIAFLVSWSALLVLWILLDWPLGPGREYFYNCLLNNQQKITMSVEYCTRFCPG